MTNKSEAKRKARIAAEKAKKGVTEQPKQQETQTAVSVNAQYTSMMKPESKAFLGK